MVGGRADGHRGREGHALAGDRGRRRGGEGRRRDGRLDGERQVGGIQRGIEEQAVAEDDPVVEAEVSGGRCEGQGLERVAQSGLEAVDEGDIDRAAERRRARDGELVVLAAGRRAADVDVEAARGGLGVVAVDGQRPAAPVPPGMTWPPLVTLALIVPVPVRAPPLMLREPPLMVPPLRTLSLPSGCSC